LKEIGLIGSSLFDADKGNKTVFKTVCSPYRIIYVQLQPETTRL